MAKKQFQNEANKKFLKDFEKLCEKHMNEDIAPLPLKKGVVDIIDNFTE